MFVRKILPAALGLWIGVHGGTSQAQENPSPLPFPSVAAPDPAPLPLAAPDASHNQRMADAIAQQLHQSGQLRGYRVDIRFADGVAELSGQVADMAQRNEVLRQVQAMTGVSRVREFLAVGSKEMLLTSQGVLAAQGAGEYQSGIPQEPASIMPGFNPGMSPPTTQPPPMPPYAWPTYAPYNNYSRVAYPTLYPQEAFPFIGPMYPFPKVPLGWRSISLKWQDGHWWYGREACGHDWWRIRYY